MGWCAEFGVQVCEGCGELMVASADRCHCSACGTDCTGKFAGCPEVWARGPSSAGQPVPVTLFAKRGGAEDHPAGGTDLTTTVVGVHARLDGLAALVAEQQYAIGGVVREQAQVVAALFAEQQDAIAAIGEQAHAVAGLVADQQKEIAGLAREHGHVVDALRSTDRTASGGNAKQDFLVSRLEQVASRLGQSLGDASGAISALRTETERVAGIGELAHASLEVARQIERTTARLDRRLGELQQVLADLAARVNPVVDDDPRPSLPREQGASVEV